MVAMGGQTIKYALFLFNLLIFILSIVIISSGAVFLSNLKENWVNDMFEGAPRSATILLITIGVIALIISFLGCCGAVKESYQLLYAYGTIIFVLFVIEIVGAAMIYGFRNDIRDESVKHFRDNMATYNTNSTSGRVIDEIQRGLHCCGAENVTDWIAFQPLNRTGPGIVYPSSCCNHTLISDVCIIPDYTTPCWQAIEDKLRHSSRTLANTSVAVAIIQFLSMLAACVLANSYKKEYDVV